MRPRRIHWIAGSLLTAGVLMLIASQAAGGASAPATLPAGDTYHHPDKSPTPKHSATPEDTATPKHSPTAEDTATPENTTTVVPSPMPPPSATPSPTRGPELDATRTPVPPTATAAPPPATPTLVREELPVVHLPPISGSGGLLAEHREGVAVLGFLLVVLSVGLIAARGAVDAERS